MRILITGASGFIGSHLAERLERDGHWVYGCDNFETGYIENWGGTLKVDIRRRHELYDFANHAKPEMVIHCAASYKDPDKWHVDTDTNVAGSINAALVAKHHDARLVYFQTVLPPVSSYAISKIAGEQYLRLCGQPLSVFRLASIFGPRNLTGPIPTFYKKLKAGEPLTIVRDVTRDFIYIDDVVEYVLWQLTAEESGTYDVGSGIETSIKTAALTVAEAAGVYQFEFEMIDKPADDVPHYDMNPTAPDWMTTSLRDAIGETVAWYDERGTFDTYTHLKIGATDAA